MSRRTGAPGLPRNGENVANLPRATPWPHLFGLTAPGDGHRKVTDALQGFLGLIALTVTLTA